MDELTILTYPDKRLARVARAVADIDGDLQAIIDQMARIMYTAPGVGLAAVQVGLDKRLLVYDDTPAEEGPQLKVLINPEIIEREGRVVSPGEGCLSVPEFRADVMRAGKVFVRGHDRDGNPCEIEAEGLQAIILQHEIDHLDGRLFIDRISVLKRGLYKKRRLKQLKKQG